MSKGYEMARKKNRKKQKLHLADNEDLLAKLHEMVRKGHQNADVAQSLIIWYMENKYWTQKQVSYAKVLTRKKKVIKKERKYYLYAIKANASIKIGYSCDIKKRLTQLQTSSPFRLKILWRYYIGKSEEEAKNYEKKLHRLCKKHHVRGEWYDAGCMFLVEQFSVREKINRDYATIQNDIKLINESPI